MDAQVDVFLRKNGTVVSACTATASTGTTASATFARGTYTFAAGDKLTLQYDSGALGGTPLLCADLEVEMTTTKTFTTVPMCYCCHGAMVATAYHSLKPLAAVCR